MGPPLFATHLILASGNGLRGNLLITAVVLSAAWEACALLAAIAPNAKTSLAAHLFDVARMGAWFALLFSLTYAADPKRPITRPGPLALLICAALVAAAVLPIANGTNPVVDRQTIVALLVVSVLGLMLIERLYRATPSGTRWHLKFLYLAIAADFPFDLCLFADGVMRGRLDPAWWSARGLDYALVIPLLSVVAARNKEWSIDIAVSRNIVFG
ncbi:MAG: hypothetical protein EXR39_19350 [Betaproteobacteria bacterium]|nr:hypothetical protein [Betaproteobacteria bacterium]